MAYTQQRGARKGTAARLTGLFKTQRQGLFVGSLRPADMEGLIEKIKAAKQASRGLTFFVWKNDRAGGPALSLSVDVERDREQRPNNPAGGKRIQADDLFGAGPANDDSLFGND